MPKLPIKTNGVENWKCPHCEQNATIQEIDRFIVSETINNFDNGTVRFTFKSITCPNPSCKKLTALIRIEDEKKYREAPAATISGSSRGFRREEPRQKVDLNMRLIPPQGAKSFPEYVPQAIRNDYEEACLILNLSPKASATLLRRCLQGIIRDFWEVKITKANGFPTLREEIAELGKKDIDQKLKQAFNDLRKIGNIGAHMEQDVDLIIDVDHGEAGVLLNFIEDVIGLTYVQRNQREKLYGRLGEIQADKDTRRNTDKNDDQS